MHLLGLTFDSKLNWQLQTNKAISKARSSLQALKIISHYFDRKKLVILSSAYFYQKLYYGLQVWLTKNLNVKFKQKLLQASSSCLRICCRDFFRLFSYAALHSLCNRSLPIQWSDYTLSMMIHDIINNEKPNSIYLKSRSKLIIHDRSKKMYLRANNVLRVGANCITNRSMKIMQMFNKDEFKLSKSQFRKLCKQRLLNSANFYN